MFKNRASVFYRIPKTQGLLSVLDAIKHGLLDFSTASKTFHKERVFWESYKVEIERGKYKHTR